MNADENRVLIGVYLRLSAFICVYLRPICSFHNF